MLNTRVVQPGILIDLNGVADLAFVRDEGDVVAIGAMTRHHDVASDLLLREHVPLVAHAAGTIGHYAIRQRGTLGGSLAHADPAAQLSMVALLLGAEMEIIGPNGMRRVTAADFFVSTFETAIGAGEILVAIRFRKAGLGEGWGFGLFARRQGDFAIAMAAARVSASGSPALVFGAVAPTPVLTHVTLAFGDADPASVVAQAAANLEIDDAPGCPAAFRREIAAAMAERALNDALSRCRRVA